MTFNFFSYLLWIMALLGFGHFLTKQSTHSKLFNGIYLATTFAIIISFFSPISLTFTLIFLLTGITIFAKNINKYDYLELLFLFISTIIISISTLRHNINYDTGLYHLPHMKWLIQGQSIKGISHINYSFGFNSSILSLSSLLAFFKQDLNDYHTGQNIIYIFVLSKVLQTMLLRKYFISFIIFIKIIFLTKIMATAPGTDFAPALLTILLFHDLITDQEFNYKSLIPLTLLILTLKLSHLAVFILPLIYFLFERNKFNLKKNISDSLPYLILPIAWIGQNIFITGCLIYPISGSCLPETIIPWSIGINNASEMSNMLMAWNRMPGPNWRNALSGTEWISSWIKNIEVQKMLIFSFSSILIGLYSFFKREFNFRVYYALYLIPTIIIWLLKAPQVRFLTPHIQLLNFIVLTTFVIHTKTLPKKIIQLSILVTIGILISHFTRGSYKGFFLPHSIPVVGVKDHPTNGLVYPIKDLCWNNGLNCTQISNGENKTQVRKILYKNY